MSKQVIISMNSVAKVSHREKCQFVSRIADKNYITLTKDQAECQGYRPCKCCDGMDNIYRMEKKTIESYLRDKDVAIDLVDHILYVRTMVGCWKIVYSKKFQTFILWHKNHVDGMLPIVQVEEGVYHRQKDRKPSASIISMIRYIYEHDMNKEIAITDYRKLRRDTRRQKKYYEIAKKKEKRAAMRRVDMIFSMLESGEKSRKMLMV